MHVDMDIRVWTKQPARSRPFHQPEFGQSADIGMNPLHVAV
jgi:hypothetical protein